MLYATNNVSSIQRRGSVPCDSYGGYSRHGKNRNRKKVLRRRSSGGAEILSPILAEPDDGAGEGSVSSSSWYCFKREMIRNRSDLDTLLSKRRGSLPVEVFAVCHSGKQNV